MLTITFSPNAIRSIILVSLFCLLFFSFAVDTWALPFGQYIKDTQSGADITGTIPTEQKISCADLSGFIETATFSLAQSTSAGFLVATIRKGGSTIAESNPVFISGGQADYTFIFSTPIEVSSICSGPSDTMQLGLLRPPQNPSPGIKFFGSNSDFAYRDEEFKLFSDIFVKDLYFIINQSTNEPPVLDPIGVQTVDEGELLEFTINATDPDDDELTFTVTNLPAGATFDPDAGVFSWAPTFEQSGGYSDIEFTVTDNGNPSLSDSETIAITVVDVPPLELTPTADSFLRSGNPDRNEGANPRLIIQSSGSRRTVVSFDDVAVANYVAEHGITSATLVLTIAENGNNWGTEGRTVDAHPLLTMFDEGNGKNAGVPASESTRGEGGGVTWNCAADTAIENQATDCDPEWGGGGYGPATVIPSLHTNGLMGAVTWDVTEEVLNGSFSWLIKKTNENQSGKMEYYSREGATEVGDMQFAPRLILVP